MERIIKVDITEKHDLVDKYNEKKIAHKLLAYILREAMLAKR